MSLDDSYTVALLHFNGADASTTFIDESGKTWTASGNAQIDTAQSKFGGASGLFDGTGDSITTPDHADFDVGSGDFTVDFWMRQNTAWTGGVLGQYSGSDFSPFMIYNNAGALSLYMSSTGGSWDKVSAGTIHTPTNGVWYHYAIVKNGTTVTKYVDGTATGGTHTVSGTLYNATVTFRVSCTGTLNGWVDELRISKGIARWTGNFTPPTAEYQGLDAGWVMIF